MPIARPDHARPHPVGRPWAGPLRLVAATAIGFGLLLGSLVVPAALAGASAHVSTANADATIVDPRGFPSASVAYLTSGGCPPSGTLNEPSVIPDGQWTFAVTDADGSTLLSTDATDQRGFEVIGGAIVSTTGGHAAPFRACPGDPAGGPNRPRTIGLAPFQAATAGGTYQVVVAATASVQECVASGDATGFGCPSLATRTATFTLPGAWATSTTASISPTVPSSGQTVVDQAAVTGRGGAPTGTIVFYVCDGPTCQSGGALVGAVDLSVGSATSPTVIAPSGGARTFRAEYWGDASNAPSASGGSGQSFTVGGAATASPTTLPTGSATGSATASPTTSATGSVADTASPSPTHAAATPPPTSSPRPTPTPRQTVPTPTPATGPILKGTPPPPTPKPTPDPGQSVNLGPCGDGKPVCYLGSPAIGSGAGQGGSTANPLHTDVAGGKPNSAAVNAYGSGGVPHFPGLNAPATNGSQGGGGQPGAAGGGGGGGQPGATGGGQVIGAPTPDGSVAGASGSAAPSGASPSASAAEAAATLTAEGSVLPSQPPNAQSLGAGPAAVGASTLPTLPAEAAGAVVSAGTAAGPPESPAAAPQSANAIAIVLVGLLVVGMAVAGWVLRLRRPRHAVKS